MKPNNRRLYLEKKIISIDKDIETALANNDFMLAQQLELALSYFEGQLLTTYSNSEMDELYNEGWSA